MVARPWHKAWRSSGSTPPERRAPNLVSFAADDPQAHASQATHRKTAPPDPGIPRASDRPALSRRPQRNHVRPIAGKRFFSRLLVLLCHKILARFEMRLSVMEILT